MDSHTIPTRSSYLALLATLLIVLATSVHATGTDQEAGAWVDWLWERATISGGGGSQTPDVGSLLVMIVCDEVCVGTFSFEGGLGSAYCEYDGTTSTGTISPPIGGPVSCSESSAGISGTSPDCFVVASAAGHDSFYVYSGSGSGWGKGDCD